MLILTFSNYPHSPIPELASFLNMNFLAHLLLSGDDEEIMVGNFIGDEVKGKQYLQYPERVQQGILLHRAIDSFADSHLLVRESKRVFRPYLDKFSGVVIDIFYDHLLATKFGEYSPKELYVFAQEAYQTIEQYWEILPLGIQKMLPYMRQDNWLYHYAQMEGIHRSLAGMSKRVSFAPDLTEAIPHFEANKEIITEHFVEFFPQMQTHATLFLDG